MPAPQSERRQSDRNAMDIATLTIQVVKLATLVEQAEKRREEDLKRQEEDRALARQMIESIEKLKDGLGSALGLQKEVLQLSEDMRVLRHDIKQLMSGQAAIAIVDKVNAEYGVRLDILEKDLSEMRGAWKFAKAAWVVLAGGGVAVLAYIHSAMKGIQ